jgi:hypothetical protein
MGISRWIYYFLSSYANPFERKVDKFFERVKSTDSISSIRDELLALMQGNLIVVNVWLEKKFKGYKYLSKWTRKKMYKNQEIIKQKFFEHIKNYPILIDKIKEDMLAKSIEFPHGDEEKILYITHIMSFLKPGVYFHYLKASSFGKLLKNPNKEALEGDCNQIVTFYAYLYSLKYNLEDLKIKLLPEHVCLNFRDVDIEATAGVFAKYKEYEAILPITEIISTNMLDMADAREDLQNISERTIVKSAQLAYAISSLKPLVAKNLEVSYRNLAAVSLKNHNFESAVFYLAKIPDDVALLNVYKSAATYFMQKNNFSKARFYADKSQDSQVVRAVKHNEGVYFFNKDSLDEALHIFEDLNEEDMKKNCYGKMYNKLSVQIADIRTLEKAKAKRHIYEKLLELANKMGDESRAHDLRETIEKF